MAGVHNPASLIRRAAVPAVAFLVIANFAGYALMGDNGILSWGDYRRQKAERSVELTRLEAERARLQHRANLLDPRNADPDLAEELVRRDLGYLRPDEIVIRIDD
ncbi:MAG: septum formation initiator family protein [Pseudomonadota bacterium]|nr:septum formation initiator family protein [Pseudomonadota bacterium]